jgi:hypothetical protein
LTSGDALKVYDREALPIAGATLVMCLFAVASTVTPLLVLASGKTLGAVVFALIAWASVVASAGFLVLLMVLPTWRRFRRIPLLVVGADGITHAAYHLHLPWSNVAEVQLAPMRHPKGEPVPVLMFVAVDNERVFREAGWWGRVAARSNVRRFAGPLWISCAALDSLPLDQVLSAIEQHTGTPVRRLVP